MLCFLSHTITNLLELALIMMAASRLSMAGHVTLRERFSARRNSIPPGQAGDSSCVSPSGTRPTPVKKYRRTQVGQHQRVACSYRRAQRPLGAAEYASCCGIECTRQTSVVHVVLHADLPVRHQPGAQLHQGFERTVIAGPLLDANRQLKSETGWLSLPPGLPPYIDTVASPKSLSLGHTARPHSSDPIRAGPLPSSAR